MTEGDRLVFPVLHQQKHVATAGWSNFYASAYGFDEYLCALAERYAVLHFAPPVLTLSDQTGSITINPGLQSQRTELFEWLAVRNNTELLNDLMAQVHFRVYRLAWYYYDKFSVVIDGDVMRSWGITPFGAKWPSGFDALDVAFKNLIYTKLKNPLLYPVKFADRLVPIGFPFVQSVVPVTHNLTMVLGETFVTDFESSVGTLGQTHYQSNQRIVAMLAHFRRWCQTGFYQPCFLNEVSNPNSPVPFTPSPVLSPTPVPTPTPPPTPTTPTPSLTPRTPTPSFTPPTPSATPSTSPTPPHTPTPTPPTPPTPPNSVTPPPSPTPPNTPSPTLPTPTVANTPTPPVSPPTTPSPPP